MHQSHLWHDRPTAFARTTDPQSSHEAAERVAVRAGSQAAQILECLRREGVVMTAEQISERTGIRAYDVRKRMKTPLEEHNYVKAINRDTTTGKPMRSGDVLRFLAVREG